MRNLFKKLKGRWPSLDEKKSKFDEDYFVGGNQSNYQDYRKRKFDKQAQDLIFILELKKTDIILDFGCATGGLLNSLRKHGLMRLIGTDISDWAIEFGKKRYPDLNIQHYNRELLDGQQKDWIFFLDVLEHMDDDELRRVMTMIHKYPPKKGFIVRTPICKKDGGKYILDISENDKTHVQRRTRKNWIAMLEKTGYKCKLFNLRTIYDSQGVLAGMFVRKEMERIIQCKKCGKPAFVYSLLQEYCKVCLQKVVKRKGTKDESKGPTNT